jgi:hypothetical protein
MKQPDRMGKNLPSPGAVVQAAVDGRTSTRRTNGRNASRRASRTGATTDATSHMRRDVGARLLLAVQAKTAHVELISHDGWCLILAWVLWWLCNYQR